jgi:hypothetical protein
MPRVRATVSVCLTLSLLLAGTVVHASQQLGHMFMALAASEGAPEALRSILLANVDSYVAGATGPDIALISFPVEEKLGQRHPGDWPHYHRTGAFTMNLLDMAETPSEVAFAWGWLTHTLVDSTIHPLVNAYGGYYTGAGLTDPERARAKERHVMLELFENRHVIEMARGRAHFPERYRVDHARVPVDLIAAAYTVTYAIAGDQLVERLWAAARAMEVTTESFLAAAGVASPRRSSSGWLAGVPAWLLGDMPTAEEYELVMHPLVVEDVALIEDAGASSLEVTYRVNDLRLLKGFADDWDVAYPQAVDRIGDVFARHWTAPRQLGLPNLDLDIGLPEGEAFDPRSAHPGNPEISSMLVTLRVTGDGGRDVPSSELWVGFGRLEENVWGGRAGRGSFRVPLDGVGPGPYLVSLGLSLADPETGEPYFDAGPASRFVGTLGSAATARPPASPLACLTGPQLKPHVESVGGSIEGEWHCTFDGKTVDPDDLLNVNDRRFGSMFVAYDPITQTIAFEVHVPLGPGLGVYRGSVGPGCDFEASLEQGRYVIPPDASGHASGWLEVDWDGAQGRHEQFARGGGTFSFAATIKTTEIGGWREVEAPLRCRGDFTLGPRDCRYSLFGCD